MAVELDATNPDVVEKLREDAGEILVAQADSGAPPIAPDAPTVTIELEDGLIARLPASADISQPVQQGADLLFIQPDGSVILIPGGAVTGLVIFLGDAEFNADAVAAIFSENNISPEEGPAQAPQNGHGNFEHRGGGIGDAFAIGDLVPPTELLFGTQSDEEYGGANLPPRFVDASGLDIELIALDDVSDEGLDGGNQDGLGVIDTTNLASSSGIFYVMDPNGDPLTFSLGQPDGTWTSGGQEIFWSGVNTNELIGRLADNTEIIRVLFQDGAVNDGHGQYSVTLSGPIDHPDPNSEDVKELRFQVTVSDNRGGTDTATFVLGIEDDSPTLIERAPLEFTVDEDDIDTVNGYYSGEPGSAGTSPNDGNADGSFTDDPADGNRGAAFVFGSLAGLVSVGADKGLKFSFIDADDIRSELLSYGLKSQGGDLSYQIIDDRLIAFVDNDPGAGHLTYDDEDRRVFELRVMSDGSFEFRLYDQLDHDAPYDDAPENYPGDVPPLRDQNTDLQESLDGDISQINFGKFVKASDFDGDSVVLDGAFKIAIRDDMPKLIRGEKLSFIVNEDDIATVNGGMEPGSAGTSPNDGAAEDGSYTEDPTNNNSGPAAVYGSLASLVASGADEHLVFSFINSATIRSQLTAYGLKSQGGDLSYQISGSRIVAFVDDEPGNGHQFYNPGDDRLVFELTLEDDGSFSFKLYDQLDHDAPYDDAPENYPGDVYPVRDQNTDLVESIDGDISQINFGKFIQATDYDGDRVILDGVFNISIRDDIPELSGKVLTRTVDEDDMDRNGSRGNHPSDGAADGSLTGGNGAAYVDGSLASLVKIGADEHARFSFQSDAVQTLLALDLQSKDTPLSYQVVDSVLYGFANSNGQVGAIYDIGVDRLVFKLTLDHNGNYVFELFDQLDHDASYDEAGDYPSGYPGDTDTAEQNFDFEEDRPGDVSAIDFGSVIKVTDHDGDSIDLDGAFKIQIRDDIPIAKSNGFVWGVVEEEHHAGGNLNDGNEDTSAAYPSSGNDFDQDVPGNYANTSTITSGSGSNSLAALVSVGADEQGAFKFKGNVVGQTITNADTNGAVTSHGYAVKIVDPPTSGSDAGGAFQLLTAKANGVVIFTLKVYEDGDWRFELKNEIDHHPVANADNVEGALKLDLSSLLKFTDFDGDSVALNADSFVVKVLDDVPVANLAISTSDPVLTVDETQAGSGQGDEPGEPAIFAPLGNKGTDPVGMPAAQYASQAGLLVSSGSSVGADNPGTTRFWLDLVGNGPVASGIFTSGIDANNNPVVREIFLLEETWGGRSYIVGRYDAPNDGDSIVTPTDPAAFALYVDPNTGKMHLAQFVSLDHSSPGHTTDGETIYIAANKILAKYTVTDSDGDSATAQVDIGGHVRFLDDVPTPSGRTEIRIVNEDDIDTDWSTGTSPHGSGSTDPESDSDDSYTHYPDPVDGGPARVTGSLTHLVNSGADNPITYGFAPTADVLDYLTKLQLYSKQSATGDGENGKLLAYEVNGNTITAREPNPNGNPVFTLSLAADGSYDFRLYDELIHQAPSSGRNENMELRSGSTTIDAIDFGAIIRATDADGDWIALAGKFKIQIQDDVPTADIAAKSGTVVIDESPGDQNDDVGSGSIPQPIRSLFAALATSGNNDPDAVDHPIEYARSGGPLVANNSIIGADSPAYFQTYSLTVTNGPASGLFVTDGAAINLSVNADGLVIGTVQSGPYAGQIAFAVAIDQNGYINIAQYLSIRHDDPSDHDENDDAQDGNGSVIQSLAGKINAVLTVKDSDGDTHSDSVAIGDKIQFEDDGPRVESNRTVTVEDDDLPSGNPSGPDDDDAPVNATGTLSHNYGVDGPGSLLLTGATLPDGQGFSSRIEDGGRTLIISQVQAGRGTVDVLKVQLSNTADGAYTVTQLKPIDHPTQNGLSKDDTENNVDFTIKYRVTDGDNDTANGTLSITVDDDTPKSEYTLKAGRLLTIDETAGLQNASATPGVPGDANDDDAAVSFPVAVSNPGSDPDMSPQVARSSGSFLAGSPNYGADGAGETVYSISISSAGVSSGLFTTEGREIFLFQVGQNLIVGRYDLSGGTTTGSDPAAFAIHVDSDTGVFTVIQYVSIKHDDRGDFDEDNDNGSSADDAIPLDNPPGNATSPTQQAIADSVLRLKVVTTDHDGDSVSQTFNIGSKITFEDDGPRALADVAAVTHTVEEDGMTLPSTSSEGGNGFPDKQDGNKEPGDFAGDDEAGGVSGSLSTLVSFGADGPAAGGGFSLASLTTGLPTLWSGGQPLTYSATASTLTATNAASQVVFTLTVNPDGSWKFDLDGQLDHIDDGTNTENLALRSGIDGTTPLSAIDFSSIIVATDRDGDPITGLAPGKLAIAVQDDIPTIAAPAEGAGPNLIVNGSFEDPSDVPGDWLIYNSITGWSSANGIPFEIQRDGAGNVSAQDGRNVVELDSDTTGNNQGDLNPNEDDLTNTTIAQSVDTVAGQTYTLTFYYAARPGHDTDNGLIASINGVSHFEVAAAGAKPSGWTPVTVTFVATGPSTVIAFTGTGADDEFGLLIDNVSLKSLTSYAVDEDGLSTILATGNNDIAPGDDPGGASVTGTLGIKWGSDAVDQTDGAGTTIYGGLIQDTPDAAGDRSVVFASTTVGVSGVTGPLQSFGVNVTFALSADGTRLIGTAGSREVIEVTLSDDDSGKFNFVLRDQLDHAPGANENNLFLTFAYTATDSDGDSVGGSFTVNVDDDIPMLVAATNSAVDEDDLNGMGNNDVAADDNLAINGSPTAGGSFGVSFGADGPAASNAISGVTVTARGGSPAGMIDLTSNNSAVSIVPQGGNAFLGKAADGRSVFSLSFDTATGNYTFTLLDRLDHPLNSTEDNIELTFSFTATDFDGDSVIQSFKVDVDDDMPRATSVTQQGTVDEDGVVEGAANNGPGDGIAGGPSNDYPGEPTTVTGQSVAALFSAGADSPLTYSISTDFSALTAQNLTSAGGTPLDYAVTVVSGVHTLTASAPAGNTVFVFTVNATNGNWTFTLHDQLDHPEGNGENDLPIRLGEMVQAKDSDGDIVTGGAQSLTITVNDDTPRQTSATVFAQVDEDELTGASTGNPDGDAVGTVATGTLASLAQSGADEPVTFSLIANPTGLPVITSGGKDVLYKVVGNVLTGYVETNINAGFDNTDRPVFTLSLAPNGAFVFTLLDQIDHLPTNPADDDNQSLVLNFTSAVQFRDADGDYVQLQGGAPTSVTTGVGLHPGNYNTYTAGGLTFDGLLFNSTGASNFTNPGNNTDSVNISGQGIGIANNFTNDNEGLLISRPGSDAISFVVNGNATGTISWIAYNGGVPTSSSTGIDFGSLAIPGNGGTVSIDPVGTFDHIVLRFDMAGGDKIRLDGWSYKAISTTGAGVFTIAVEDDIPIAKVGTVDTGIVHEDALPDGHGESGQGQTTTVTITSAALAALVDVGADEGPTFSLRLPPAPVSSGLTSRGETVNWVALNSDTLQGVAVGGRVVFELRDNGDGTFTFELKDQVDHLPLTSGQGDLETITLDLGAHFLATDFDGDSVALIGSVNVKIENDIGGNTGVVQTIHVREDALSTLSPVPADYATGNPDVGTTTDEHAITNAILQTLVDPGADDPATFALRTGASGLVLGEDGEQVFSNGLAIRWGNDGGNVVGFVNGSGGGTTGAYDAAYDRIVFQISSTGGGDYLFDLRDRIDHRDVDGNGGLGDAAVRLIDISHAFTATDFDGDTISLGQKSLIVSVENDVPTIVAKPDADSITVDETDLGLSGVGGVAASSFFTVSFGADGPRDSNPVHSFALGLDVTGGRGTGLVATISNLPVFLFEDNGVIYGRAGSDAASAEAGPTVFTISLVGGNIVVDQDLAVRHTDTSSYDEPTGFSGAGKILLSGTATDFDLDSASATIDITGKFIFKDDGPTLTVTVDTPMLGSLVTEVDETAGTTDSYNAATAELNGEQQGSNDNTAEAQVGLGRVTTAVAGGLGALFIVGGSSGNDGGLPPSGVLAFTGFGTTGTDVLATNLSATDGGSITLHLEAGVIVGRDTDGHQVFTIEIVGSGTSAQLQTTLYEAIEHDNAGNLYDQQVPLLIGGNGAVGLEYAVTRVDGDGDSIVKSATVTLADSSASVFSFDDDGPSVSPVTAAFVLDDEAQALGIDGSIAVGDVPGFNERTISGDLVPPATGGSDGIDSIAFSTSVTVTNSASAANGPLEIIYVDPVSKLPTVEQVTWTWAQNGSTGGGTLTGTTAHYTGVGVVPAAIVLTVAADGSYTFTANAPLHHPFHDAASQNAPGATGWEDDLTLAFTYTVKDGDNDTASSTLSITINDDTPTASNTELTSVEGQPAGNPHGNIFANSAAAFGADGGYIRAFSVGGVTFTYDPSVPSITPSGSYQANYGTVSTSGAQIVVQTDIGGQIVFNFADNGTNAAGDWSYQPPLSGIDESSTDKVENFSYQIVDGDGDIASASLTVTVAPSDVPDITDDDGDPLSQTVSVYEAGLPPRGGEPAGTGEAADGLPNNASDPSEHVIDGTFKITAQDTIKEITITPDGSDAPVTKTLAELIAANAAAPIIVETVEGVLKITNFNPSTGVVTYTYTLEDDQDHSSSPVSDHFVITVTDVNLDTSAPYTLNVTIVDDAPITANDGLIATVAEKVSGVDIGPVSLILGNDRFGADGEAASGSVTFSSGSAGGSISVVGGRLIYTNTTANASPTADVLDSFTYSITDGDGDTSAPATFSIKLTDTGLSLVSASNPLLANEDDIVGGGGNPGTALNGDDTQTLTGTLNYTLGEDALGSIVLSTAGGTTSLLTLAGDTVNTSWVGNQLIGHTGTDPDMGRVFTITMGAGSSILNSANSATYTLELLQPVRHAGTDPGFEDDTPALTVVATIQDADGSTETTNFSVVIDDDTPTVGIANSGLAVEEGSEVTGTYALAAGADGVPPANITVSVDGGATYQALGTIPTSQGTLVIDANGTWKFTAATNLDNDLAQTFTFHLKAVDGDGDVSVDSHTIEIIDGTGPTGGTPVPAPLDDANLSDGRAPANPDYVDVQVGFQAGSDALTSFAFESGTGSLGGGLSWQRVSDTLVEGRAGIGGTLIVSLTITAAPAIAANASGAATVRVQLHDNYALHPQVNVDDLVQLGAVGVVARDHDGESVTRQVSVSVSDDTPVVAIADAPTSVNENQTTNGTWTLAAGADGVTSVAVQVGAETKYLTIDGSALLPSGASTDSETFNVAGGTLTVRNDGTWSFTGGPISNTTSFTFKITATDGDLDTSCDTQTVQVIDIDTPFVDAGNAKVTVEEEHLSPLLGNPLIIAQGNDDILPDPEDKDVSGDLNQTTNQATIDLTSLFSGGDGAITYGFNVANGTQAQWSSGSLPMTSGGQPVLYFKDGTTLWGYVNVGGNADAYEPSSGDRAVFSLNIANPAAAVFTLLDRIDHHASASADGVETIRSLNLSGVIRVTDEDDDHFDLTTVEVEIIDDIPVAKSVVASPVLDDENLSPALFAANPGNGPGGTGDVASVNAFVSGAPGALFTPGADGFGSISFTTSSINAVYKLANGNAATESVNFSTPTFNSITGITTYNATGSVSGQAVFTLEVGADGSYTFTQKAPLAHPTNSVDEEDLDVVINFTVKDRDGDAHSGSLTVKVNDDTPVTTNDTASVNEGAKASLDLVIVIDRSGSMDAQSGVTTQFGTTRIALAREAATQLINSADVRNVLIVDFSDDADNTGWMSKADALAFIALGGSSNSGYGTNFGNNSGTNFNAALNANPTGTSDDGVVPALSLPKTVTPAGAQTFMYFLSDGEPSSGDNITAARETQWISDISGKIDRVFAVGMGTGVGSADITALEPIAWQPGETQTTNSTSDPNVKIIATADFSTLIGTLTSVLPGAVAGNVLVNDAMGADGFGRIVSIRIDSDGDGIIEASDDLYTYNAAGNDILKNGAAWTPGNDTSELVVATAKGGVFKFDFVDPDGAGPGKAGDWEYSTPNTDITAPIDEKFRYTVADGDGDQATGDLTVTVINNNVAPVNTLPSQTAFNEDTTKAITGLQIADTDAGSGSLTVTLTVTHGVLNVAGGTATIAGSGTTAVTLTGTVAQINATLVATVNFVPDQDYNGSATLTMVTNDNGNSGSGGAKSDTDAITLTINAVNDAPKFAGTTLTVISNAGNDGSVSFTEAALAAYFSDVDSSGVGIATFGAASGLNSGNTSGTQLNNNTTTGTLTITDSGAGAAGLGGTLSVTATDGSATSSPATTVTFTNNSTSTSALTAAASGDSIIVNDQTAASTLTGGSGNDWLIGNSGVDTMSGNSGNDTFIGGGGADVMSGGAGIDTFNFAAGDSTLTIGGTGTAGTISGYDVITDFKPGATAGTSEKIGFTGATIVADGAGNGSNSSLQLESGRVVGSHSISSGIITFDDAPSSGMGSNAVFSSAYAITSLAQVAAVVQYLQGVDIGQAGSTVAFEATISGAKHTYLFIQGSDNGNTNTSDVLIDLVGVDATSVSVANNQISVIGTTTVDPIILDLDNNGFTFGALANGATFDINADGAADRLAWNTSNDGILAMDLDGDGIIDNGSEIFTPDFNNGGFRSGGEALASLDENGDGVIDASDSAFSRLSIWQDANADGVTDAGELTSLAEHNIASISAPASPASSTIDGQEVIGQGSFTRTDGSVGSYVEVALETEFGGTAQELDWDNLVIGTPGEADNLQGTAGADRFTLTDLDAVDLIADYNADQGDVVDLSAIFGPDSGVTADNAGDYVKYEGDTLKVDTDGAGTAHDFVDVAVIHTPVSDIRVILDDGVDVSINHL